MEEAMHTRGPWKAVEIGQGGSPENPMPIYEIHSADDRAVIAEYVDAKNAPLLQAAPDLLEALQELLDSVEGMADTFKAPQRKARAAIAKATALPA